MPGQRPIVLLLAGELRDSWRSTLEEAGLVVRTAGWLDAVTSARLDRPDLVLVSMDLPTHAPQVLTTGFRASSDLAGIPVAIAGVSEELAEELRDQPIRADRYIPSPRTPESLAREVHEAIRIGRVPFRRTPAENAGLAVAGLGALALCTRVLWDGVAYFAGNAELPPAADAALLAAGLAALGVGIAIAVLGRKRPLALRQRRASVAWAAFLLSQLPNLVGGSAGPKLAPVGLSLACLAGIAWAWLGLRLQPPPTHGWRRWYQFVMVFLAAVAAAPWVALAILRDG